MPKLRILSGKDVAKVLVKFEFEIVTQRGSHAKLRRVIDGSRQTLTIPLHAELDMGTLRAIYSQATRYIAADDLHPFFYTE
jgi:predicted RNA binding protein YcfA (HicA-like mRNA interferase family)